MLHLLYPHYERFHTVGHQRLGPQTVELPCKKPPTANTEASSLGNRRVLIRLQQGTLTYHCRRVSFRLGKWFKAKLW